MTNRYPQLPHVSCFGVFDIAAAAQGEDDFLYAVCIHRGHVFRINADNTISAADDDERQHVERFFSAEIAESYYIR